MKLLKPGIVISLALILCLSSCDNSLTGYRHGEHITFTDGEINTQDNTSNDGQVTGFVRSDRGEAIAGSIIRIQATETFTVSDNNGRFIFDGLLQNEKIVITAYSPGYYISATLIEGFDKNYEVILLPHTKTDNPNYQWLSAGITIPGNGDGSVCADCHSSTNNNMTLPFDEWKLDAHALSGINPRFLSMYGGTDIDNNQSPQTTYVIDKEYGRIPIPPAIDETYFGPGFLLDFPESSGNCSVCHLPLAAFDEPYDTNPFEITGIAKDEGINCDFCHKIWDVKLNNISGLPNSNMGGILSIEMRRPDDGHQLFIGPFDDVAPGEDTYSELQNESQFCAPCHFGDFWDVQIYNSFGEWLDSPYAVEESDLHKTCQDCHMKPLGYDHFAQIEEGGLIRDPSRIFSHKMLGAFDEEFLQDTAEVLLDASIIGSDLVVDITVKNENGGHHIPTDSPLRQIILVVQATNQKNEALRLLSGDTLPSWVGNYSGLPGKYFAKLLEQLWTGEFPTGAYWTQTTIVEDTRLAALESDLSTYVFDLNDTDEIIEIEARLLFRRAYYSLMEYKGWDTPDILMESVSISFENDRTDQ